MRTNRAKAVRRGLVIEVLKRGRIETTLAKAKSVQGEVDKIINWVKENSVNARRQIVKTLGQDVKLAGSFAERQSGYSRIVRLGQRAADTAEMVILELIADQPKVEEKPVKKTKIAKKQNESH